MQLDSFYFNVLPFAEDVREFQFPTFSNLPAFCQPNEQQLEATDNLVKMLDLAPDGKEEVLLPDLTPNPILEVHILFIYLFDIVDLAVGTHLLRIGLPNFIHKMLIKPH